MLNGKYPGAKEGGMSRILIAAFVVIVIAVPVFAGEAVTYEKDIKGIIAKRCLFCHGTNPPLDTYENLMVLVKGSDAGALMRTLDDGKNTKDGKPGFMYRRLGKTDAERAANLEIFKKWIGNWTLKRRKELSKEELEGIKAPEK